ncbi:MAG: hypothetical protein AABY95_08465 [Pseudomonadota bacterium]
MATIRKVEYYVLQTPNKPGHGAWLFTRLKQHGVSLLAMTAFPNGLKSQVDLMPENAAKLKAAAKKMNLKLSAKKTGFLMQGSDRAGAIVGVLDKLGRAKINIVAIDAVTAGWRRFGAIFWVKPADVAKAAKLLKAK